MRATMARQGPPHSHRACAGPLASQKKKAPLHHCAPAAVGPVAPQQRPRPSGRPAQFRPRRQLRPRRPAQPAVARAARACDARRVYISPRAAAVTWGHRRLHSLHRLLHGLGLLDTPRRTQRTTHYRTPAGPHHKQDLPRALLPGAFDTIVSVQRTSSACKGPRQRAKDLVSV